MKPKYAMLIGIVLCLAVMAAAPLAAFDRGTQVNVQLPVDLDALSQLPDTTLYTLWVEMDQYKYEPAWPSDNNIYFMGNARGVYRVPATGGTAEMLIPTAAELEGNVFTNLPIFVRPTMASDPSDIYVRCGKSYEGVVKKYNLENGESTVIGPGDYPEVSASGRYLVYVNQLYVSEPDNEGQLKLVDLTTDTETILDTGGFYGMCFTGDESEVIYSKAIDTANFQLFRIPITGGTPVQITTYDGGILGKIRSKPRIHPNGNLIVYTDRNFDADETVTDGQYSVRWYPTQICVYNLTTGETMYMFPYDETSGQTMGEVCEYFWSRFGVFSPDGTQICYSGIDFLNDSRSEQLYIFDFVAAKYGPGPTVVEEDVPEPFAAVQNFPNPFNPTTTISFTIPEAGFTEVSIFNITGQKVRTLVAGELSAGTHQLVWDGCDDQNNPVSSGVFVSQLSSGGNVATNRMTLVR